MTAPNRVGMHACNLRKQYATLMTMNTSFERFVYENLGHSCDTLQITPFPTCGKILSQYMHIHSFLAYTVFQLDRHFRI